MKKETVKKRSFAVVLGDGGHEGEIGKHEGDANRALGRRTLESRNKMGKTSVVNLADCLLSSLGSKVTESPPPAFPGVPNFQTFPRKRVNAHI